MAFYTFKQNNSGGIFDHEPERGIGYAVSIEADSPADANQKAEEIGLYFNGCDDGRDCDCCGDRWYEADSYDAEDSPTLYGNPITGRWGISSYVHYLDGRVEEFLDS